MIEKLPSVLLSSAGNDGVSANQWEQHQAWAVAEDQQQKPTTEFIELKLVEYLVLTQLQLCGYILIQIQITRLTLNQALIPRPEQVSAEPIA